MLRINRVFHRHGTTLKLEGKLLSAWVDELRRAATEISAQRAALSLDLAYVTFVDADGAKLLADLVKGGADVVGCSSFVAELLDGVHP